MNSLTPWLFGMYLACVLTLGLNAQSTRFPLAKPSLPGYSGFHSNLGLQEIVEVGVPLSESAPDRSTPAEILSPPPSASSSMVPDGESEEAGFSITPQAGLRFYRTSNVLRTPSATAEGSGILESNFGVGVSRQAFPVNDYITMIPRVDLMMQWANYAEKSDVLNYRFGMVKGGVALGLPNDWSMGVTLDYNVLHNQKTGDRTFDAISPALSLQKIHSLGESSFLMGDLMYRRSSTKQSIEFPAAGIFADSGDNDQLSLSLTYVQMLGEDGRFTFMPRLGYNRTSYNKYLNSGRTDNLLTLGASFIFNWTEWLSLQSFFTFSSMSSNVIQRFDASDFGLSMSISHRF